MLSVISLDEMEKWDEIVKSFDEYDIYYLSGYSKAFEIHGDGTPVLFYYEGDDIRAMNVVMKRDIGKDKNFINKIPLNTYFDLSTPYGYGGFITEGEKTIENLLRLNEKYIFYCKENGIIGEFVRFHPVLKNYINLEPIYNISIQGKTITINLESFDQIWNNLVSKNRNVIRKAKKSGVKIYWGRNPELIKKFLELYIATMDKDNAKSYYYFQKDFFDSILYDVKYNFLMFYAMYEGQIIAMSIILFANKQIHYHLSASSKEHQSLAPTNLLLYEVACWGVSNGLKTFHLGGGLGGNEDSLYKFKKAFNKNSDGIFAVGKKIFNEKKYKELISIRSKEKNFVKNTTFFPVYRG